MGRPRFTIPEASTADFMVVRPEVVKTLGNASDALVLVRITFRCELLANHSHIGPDGHVWWAATHEELASDTGLTKGQVRGSLDRLVGLGHLLVEEHRTHGYSDRTKSYRPVRIEHLEMSAETSVSGVREHLEMSAETSVPLLIKNATAEDIKNGESGTWSELFEEAWKHWPRSESKKKAREKFEQLKDPRTVAAAIIAHGDAHRQNTDPKFVPYLVTWLNQERWDEDPPISGRVKSQQDRDLELLARYQNGGDEHASLESGR